MISPAEEFADQIIRVASKNYDRGVRDGVSVALGTLEALGVISTPIAAGMQAEMDRLLKTRKAAA